MYNNIYIYIYYVYLCIIIYIYIYYGFISTENVIVRYTDFMFSVSPSRWDDPN